MIPGQLLLHFGVWAAIGASTVYLGVSAWLGVAFYLALVRALRYQRLRQISALHPVKDASVISQAFAHLESPFLYRKALEFGLFRTYAIPSVSKLLLATRELTERASKRYDDTDLLICEFVDNALDSDRAILALKRMNYIHRMYKIDNLDYLYVLSVFIYEPIRWQERFGFRPMCRGEKQALFNLWARVGKHMGIKDIPATLDEFDAWNRRFERDCMRFQESNRAVADATVDLFVSIVPAMARPLMRKITYALCDDLLLEAFGYPRQSALLVACVTAGLKAWQFTQRHLLLPRPRLFAVRRSPRNPTKATAGRPLEERRFRPTWQPFHDTYPNGYRIAEMGPSKAPPGALGPLEPMHVQE